MTELEEFMQRENWLPYSNRRDWEDAKAAGELEATLSDHVNYFLRHNKGALQVAGVTLAVVTIAGVVYHISQKKHQAKSDYERSEHEKLQRQAGRIYIDTIVGKMTDKSRNLSEEEASENTKLFDELEQNYVNGTCTQELISRFRVKYHGDYEFKDPKWQ